MIAAPTVRDRVVHRALIDEIGPTFEQSFIAHSYACGKRRGPHRAVLQYLAWTRRHSFRLALDIRQYFPSIRHRVLCDLLFRKVRDRRTRALIEVVVAAGGTVYQDAAARAALGLDPHPGEPCGMPLGTFVSQWCGALYLDAMDHFVLRELKVGPYLRYMDDFVLFGDDRERLVAAREALRGWLDRERGLRLNPKKGHVVPATEPAVFLGYRVSRSGLCPSRKLRRRMKPRVLEAARHGPAALERTLAAYRGLLTF